MGYLFIDMATGKKLELEISFSDLFENQNSGGFYRHNGNLLRRDVAGELARDKANFKSHSTKLVKSGPLNRVSEAGAFHPEQVGEAREHLSKVHSGIEVLDNGNVKFTSRSARKAFLNSQGFIDRDGGYSD